MAFMGAPHGVIIMHLRCLLQIISPDSLEESDNEDISIPLLNRSPCQLNTQYIGDIVTEISPVEDEGTLLDDEEGIEIDFGKNDM